MSSYHTLTHTQKQRLYQTIRPALPAADAKRLQPPTPTPAPASTATAVVPEQPVALCPDCYVQLFKCMGMFVSCVVLCCVVLYAARGLSAVRVR